jgi:hypothetical protein
MVADKEMMLRGAATEPAIDVKGPQILQTAGGG